MNITISESYFQIIVLSILLMNIYYSLVIIKKPNSYLFKIFGLIIIWVFPFIGTFAFYLFDKITSPSIN